MDVDVTPVNDVPVFVDGNGDPISGNVTETTPEDTPVNGTLTANDPDGDPLTYTKGSDPTNGSVTVNTDGTWTYTPKPDYNGPDSFTVTVDDGQGGTSTITVDVDVTPVNDAPVAVADSITVVEDTPFTSTVSLVSNDTDVDQDELTAVAGTFTTTAGGTIVIAADGSYTYTPLLNFHGTDTVDYTVTDGTLTDTGTLTITVKPNTPPEGTDKAFTLFEDGSQSFTAAYFGFSDADAGQSFTGVRIDTLPTAGMLTLKGTAVVAGAVIAAADFDKLVYKPAADGHGTNYSSFTFSVQDSTGSFDTEPNTMSFDVTAVDDIADDTAAVGEGNPVTINVLGNDSFTGNPVITHVNGQSISVGSPVTLTNGKGSVALGSDGQLTFTPAPGVSGTSVDFDYVVISGGQEESATVSVNVLGNDASSVTEAGVKMEGGLQVADPGVPQATGNVLANDGAGAGGSQSVTKFTIGTDVVNAGQSIVTDYGTITIKADGSYTYTLDNSKPATQALDTGDSVDQVITYTVTDAEGNEATSTLTVTVNGTNDAPSVEFSEVSKTPVITGGNKGGGANFENGDLTNGTLFHAHTLHFNAAGADGASVRAVINISEVDNSFRILVNGVNILEKIAGLEGFFQLENGDNTVAGDVALRFADGGWTSSDGNAGPWDPHSSGLPRIQVIITEEGVRFFATRTKTSTVLEELFIGTKTSSKNLADIFPNGLTNPGINLPDFNSGANDVVVQNINGTGVDEMKGYLSVTTGGRFEVADWDDQYVSKAVITLVGTQFGDNLYAVLPNGMVGTTTTVNGNLVLTLTSKTSDGMLLSDVEEALRSTMFFGGNGAGERKVQIVLTDDNGAESNALEGEVYFGNKTLAAGGSPTIQEWSTAGFKVIGFTDTSLFEGGLAGAKLQIGTVDGKAADSGLSTHNSTAGSGIGVGSASNNAETKQGEYFVVDLDKSGSGFDAAVATLTLNHYTAGEVLRWYVYEADGTLAGSGVVPASTTNSGTTNTIFDVAPNVSGSGFKYIVLTSDNATSNFLVDGLTAKSHGGLVTLGEFEFAAPVSAAAMFAAPAAFHLDAVDGLQDDVGVAQDQLQGANHVNADSGTLADLADLQGTPLLSLSVLEELGQEDGDDDIASLPPLDDVLSLGDDDSNLFDLDALLPDTSATPAVAAMEFSSFAADADLLTFMPLPPLASQDDEQLYSSVHI